MQIEEWRPIPGFPQYVVSSRGRVVSYHRAQPRELKSASGHRGHRGVALHRDGVGHRRWVHALVMEAFVGPRAAGMEVRHLDGDSSNNSLANLAYGTSSANSYDSVAHGTHVNARKTHCIRGHEFTEENTQRSGGRRFCRTCRRVQSLAAYHRRARRAVGLPA